MGTLKQPAELSAEISRRPQTSEAFRLCSKLKISLDLNVIGLVLFGNSCFHFLSVFLCTFMHTRAKHSLRTMPFINLQGYIVTLYLPVHVCNTSVDTGRIRLPF